MSLPYILNIIIKFIVFLTGWKFIALKWEMFQNACGLLNLRKCAVGEKVFFQTLGGSGIYCAEGSLGFSSIGLGI